MDRHIRISHEDDLVLAGNIPQDPVGFNAFRRIHFRVFIDPLLQAVMEIIDLQIRKSICLMQRLKQQTSKLLVRPHRSARIDEYHDLQPVLSRWLHPDVQDPAPSAGMIYRAANIQLFLAGFQLA